MPREERENRRGGDDMPKWRCEAGWCIMDSGDTSRVGTRFWETPTMKVCHTEEKIAVEVDDKHCTLDSQAQGE